MKGIELQKVINDLDLEKIYIANNIDEVLLKSGDINRPGLQLTGYYNQFSPERLQIIGEQEWHYINELNPKERHNSLKKLFSYNIPGVVFCGNNYIHDEIIELSKIHDVSLFRTSDTFSKFTGVFQNYVEDKLAPKIRKHGVLLDIYGVGVLITGKAGIGKSEAALNLISKGSKLVSDDSVIIKNIDSKLIGTSPEITKHFMELRGVGIIDVQKLFGIGFVMEEKEIEMIVDLESWDSTKDYERLGLEDVYEEILGIKIVKYTIPVRPGRDIALIIEVATKNFKQKEMGYNPAVELNNRILNSRNNKNSN
ncbi:HPr(Ser) kinase/phosphatase [Anaerosphaera multitolerans]|uniref:HPr kinase/phosphorylase n=1 Tax=Anaerosphaera multitolerans TaxID=2487351 RepID=A0A437S8K8_9FIRM|nr:HPr(Ser) kinase/phosphatase [Anaerosphaera multitolerans]RVU55178.1 HPr(Ser) kinase/phosphatase [Anaerosphaera multitolerans]